MRLHIGVIGPEPLEAAIRRIHPGKPLLNRHLGQAGVNLLAIGQQAFGTIALEDRAIEVPEGEKSRRRAGAWGCNLPQDFVVSLKNMTDDPGIVRFFRAAGAMRRQHEPEDQAAFQCSHSGTDSSFGGNGKDLTDWLASASWQSRRLLIVDRCEGSAIPVRLTPDPWTSMVQPRPRPRTRRNSPARLTLSPVDGIR